PRIAREHEIKKRSQADRVSGQVVNEQKIQLARLVDRTGDCRHDKPEARLRAAEMGLQVSAHPFVVPAKAGTHTPCPLGLTQPTRRLGSRHSRLLSSIKRI